MPRCEKGKQLAYHSGKIHTSWLIINASAYKANINSLHSVATPCKFKTLKNVMQFSNNK
jgi:hypothetical protein